MKIVSILSLLSLFFIIVYVYFRSSSPTIDFEVISKDNTTMQSDIPRNTNNIIENKDFDPKRVFFINGVKFRKSSVTQENEYYLKEYSNNINSDQNQISKGIPPLNNVLWNIKLSRSICGKPLIHNGIAHLVSFNKEYYGIRLRTGELLYTEKINEQPIHNQHLDGNFFYIPQRNGNIQAFDLDEKKFLWNHRSKTDIVNSDLDISMSSISIIGPKMYLSKHWGNLYAVNKTTGVIIADPGVPYESRIQVPAVQWQDNILFTNIAGEVFCVDSKTMKIKWEKSIESGYILSWLVFDNDLIFTTTDKNVISKNLNSFATNWETKTQNHAFQSIKIVDNSIIVAAGTILNLNGSTGEVQWKFMNKDATFQREFEIYDQTIYASSNNGLITAINSNNGESKIIANLKEPVWYSPSYSKGIILIGTTNKNLYAIKVK